MKNIKKPKIIYFIFVLSVLAALYLTANAISIWDYSTKIETRTADIAIILGAAANDEGVSPVFRERINHGILLYQKGYVKKLIITGGYGKGHHYSDSYIGKQYAVEQGIPADDKLLNFFHSFNKFLYSCVIIYTLRTRYIFFISFLSFS